MSDRCRPGRAAPMALLFGLLIASAVGAQPGADLPASRPTPAQEAVSPATQAASQPDAETAPATQEASTPSPTAQHRPQPSSGPAPSAVWENSDEAAAIAARGSIATCEAVTLPLVLLPGVGEVVGLVVEWACLVPALLALEYVETHHGKRPSQYWQPALALVLSKGFRELVTYPAMGIGIGLAVAYLAGATPVIVLVPYLTPVVIAGALTLAGGGYLVYRKVRDRGADLVFQLAYPLLMPGEVSPVERQQRQADSWVRPPLTGWARAWALMATAAGAEAERSLLNWIPVAGPWIKAQSHGESIKKAMRQTAREVLLDDDGDLEAMDDGIEVLAVTEGLLGSVGQALLFAGGGLTFAGGVAAALAYQSNEDLGQYAAIATTTGLVGIGVAGSGLGLILAREIPRALRPFVVPALFGFGEDPEAETE